MKKILVSWKIHIDRSRMYLSYVQFFMIGIVFYKSLFGDMKNPLITMPLLFIVFIGGSIFIGWLETKIGFRSEEAKKMTSYNPTIMGMEKDIQDIKKSIDKLIYNQNHKL